MKTLNKNKDRFDIVKIQNQGGLMFLPITLSKVRMETWGGWDLKWDRNGGSEQALSLDNQENLLEREKKLEDNWFFF